MVHLINKVRASKRIGLASKSVTNCLTKSTALLGVSMGRAERILDTVKRDFLRATKARLFALMTDWRETVRAEGDC